MLELCVLYIYRAYCIIVDLFYRAYSIVNLFTNFRAFLDKFLSILTALCPVYIIIPINVGPRNKSIHLIIGEHITMECYATPWPLWRESWILWHIVEPSFAFVIILAHCLGGGVIFLQHFISQTWSHHPACKPKLGITLIIGQN